ncbi:MAG: glycosyltransferase [Candidatus Zixiibacteriota bacterium]
MNNSILIIAYYFPPLAMGGVQRIAKLAKYLPQLGYQVHVITVKPIRYPAYDKSLFDEIPDEVKIHRSGSSDPARLTRYLPLPLTGLKSISRMAKKTGMIWPDSKIGWKKYAIKKAEEVIAKQKIDLILSSSPPITAHLVAREISEKFQIPWIADFRDIWESRGPEVIYKDKSLIKKSYDLLSQIGQTASAITAINKTIAAHISSTAVSIPGGYDPDDFVKLQATSDTKNFILCYLGTIHSLHPIEPFLQAAHLLASKKGQFGEKFKFVFIGANDRNEIMRLAEKYEMTEKIEVIDYLPHREALSKAASAGALLLSAAENHKDILTGKIFDYMGLESPILGAVPHDGEAALMITRHRGGLFASPNDIIGLAEAMEILFNRWQKSEKWEKTELDVMTRLHAAKQFAGVFEKVLDA